MAVRKSQTKTSSSTKSAQVQERRKFKRGSILLAALIALLIMLLLGLWWLKGRMLDKNPRLTLQVVKIDSTGYWGQGGNKENLVSELDLKVGSDNMMALDMNGLRKKILAIPNVADAQVIWMLPDTLHIKIDERVPKAFLAGGELVVDSNALVMNSRECLGVHEKLPVITVLGGSGNEYQPGSTATDTLEALALLNAMQENGSFEAVNISVLRNKNILSGTFRYHGNGAEAEEFVVKLPLLDCNYPAMLEKLRLTADYLLKEEPSKRVIDLTVDQQIVIK
ncbi:MAG: FtsQ-type POTRA domain-containing protein [Lentisphaerae bacterium]|nr:FtsQ-type POTRA domain-containing protein [Lentisphaerota bacterium]